MDDRLDTARTTPGTDGRLDNKTMGQLMHLSEMDDFEIADGEPDIRGWDVRAANGDKIGDVEDLLVDSASLRVRYIEVELEKDLVANNDRRHALIPIGSARLNDDKDDVMISLDSKRLLALPPYVRGTLSREYEQSLLDGLARPSDRVVSTDKDRDVSTDMDRDMSTDKDRDFYDGEHFDDRRTFETRRELGRRDDAYLRRRAE